MRSPFDRPFGIRSPFGQQSGAPELISNPGNPFAATTGWTEFDANAALSIDTGSLKLTTTATSYAHTSITTEIGATYNITGVVTAAATGGGFYGVRKSDAPGSLTNTVNIFVSPTSPGAFSGSFTATATTTYINLQVNGVGHIAISSISVKRA